MADDAACIAALLKQIITKTDYIRRIEENDGVLANCAIADVLKLHSFLQLRESHCENMQTVLRILDNCIHIYFLTKFADEDEKEIGFDLFG